MGAITCPRHGVDSSGPLACDHVGTPLWNGASPPAAVPLTFELDADVRVGALVCEVCAAAYGVVANAVLDFETHPLVASLAPICGRCLAERPPRKV
jgi:hypothetical protein